MCSNTIPFLGALSEFTLAKILLLLFIAWMSVKLFIVQHYKDDYGFLAVLRYYPESAKSKAYYLFIGFTLMGATFSGCIKLSLALAMILCASTVWDISMMYWSSHKLDTLSKER